MEGEEVADYIEANFKSSTKTAWCALCNQRDTPLVEFTRDGNFLFYMCRQCITTLNLRLMKLEDEEGRS